MGKRWWGLIVAAALAAGAGACGSGGGANESPADASAADCPYQLFAQGAQNCQVYFFCDAGLRQADCAPLDGGTGCACWEGGEGRWATRSDLCQLEEPTRAQTAREACGW